jgi:hypothetical protein
VGLVCVVAAVTFATRAHELPLTPFVASAKKIASGQIWVLPASALVVDKPFLIGLTAFAMLAVATLRICVAPAVERRSTGQPQLAGNTTGS